MSERAFEHATYCSDRNFGNAGQQPFPCSCHVAEIERLRARVVPVKVVAAVIRTERGDYIIGQRKPGQWMGGKWCFVGGKVESGESLEEAVAREVREEIGIEVSVEGMRHHAFEQYEHGLFELHYFDCLMPDGQIPQLLECSDTASVSPNRLSEYDLLPVDIDIARQLALTAESEKLRSLLRRAAALLDPHSIATEIREALK